jgi:hypothetical protein
MIRIVVHAFSTDKEDLLFSAKGKPHHIKELKYG